MLWRVVNSCGRGRSFAAGKVTGQKKAGNYKMPEGVCFAKHSKTILEKL